jgi:hypothetical protein
VAVKRRGGKEHQDAAEPLVLDDADPTVAERFDGEAVVAVEPAGKQQMAEPAQPPAGVGLQHGGPQGGTAAAGRLHAEVQALAGAGGAAGPGDERVPVGVGGRVGEDLPDPLWVASISMVAWKLPARRVLPQTAYVVSRRALLACQAS